MSKPYKQKAGNQPERKPTARMIASQQPDRQPFFYEAVAEIMDAETQMLAAWPALAQASFSPSLRHLFHQCMEHTNSHIERLQKVEEILGSFIETKCIEVTAIIATARNFSPGINADDTLTIAAQKFLHFLIASYEGLTMLANTLQHPQVASLLQASLQELRLQDESLSSLSAGNITDIAA